MKNRRLTFCEKRLVGKYHRLINNIGEKVFEENYENNVLSYISPDTSMILKNKGDYKVRLFFFNTIVEFSTVKCALKHIQNYIK